MYLRRMQQRRYKCVQKIHTPRNYWCLEVCSQARSLHLKGEAMLKNLFAFAVVFLLIIKFRNIMCIELVMRATSVVLKVLLKLIYS